MLRDAIKALVMPPLSLFLLAMIGLLVRRRRPRLGGSLVGLAVSLLVLASLPWVGDALLVSLQQHPPLQTDGLSEEADAIVVLSAEIDRAGFEYGGATVGPLTLQRMRYAAHLSRATGLPILVSGGVLEPGDPPLGSLMQEVLAGEFGVTVRWVEGQSRTTRENARLSASILSADGVGTVLLVSHAWHLPRAVPEFEQTGLRVIAAPTGFRPWPEADLSSFVPSMTALVRSSWWFHEQVGRLYYGMTR